MRLQLSIESIPRHDGQPGEVLSENGFDPFARETGAVVAREQNLNLWHSRHYAWWL